MQHSTLCASVGTAVIRDVRCWYSGTTNNSNQFCPMKSVGYYAPLLPHTLYNTLSPRAQVWCRLLVKED
jgi:hypothetical protein